MYCVNFDSGLRGAFIVSIVSLVNNQEGIKMYDDVLRREMAIIIMENKDTLTVEKVSEILNIYGTYLRGKNRGENIGTFSNLLSNFGL